MGNPLHEIPDEAQAQLPAQDTAAGRAARFLLQRFPVWPIVAFLAKKKVPVHRHSLWYMTGSIALFFFCMQVITGVLLMVYYRPGEPWGSVQRIVMEVPFGNVIRSVHHWSANLMILTLFVHLFATFFMKAYRRPREFTWLTGLALLGMAMFFGFSGYLLPWDELSFFATRIGVSEMEKMPVAGPWMAQLAMGGEGVTMDTIGRFYTLHVVVLPLALAGLVGVHLLFIQLQGISEPDDFAARPAAERRYEKFFSEYLIGEIPVWLALGTVLIALAAALPRALHPEADPFASAPEGIKPEWYFLAQYQLLKLFPGKLEYVGLALMTAVPLAVLALPFLDRSIPTDARGRWVTRIGGGALLGLLIFTLWGWLS